MLQKAVEMWNVINIILKEPLQTCQTWINLSNITYTLKKIIGLYFNQLIMFVCLFSQTSFLATIISLNFILQHNMFRHQALITRKQKSTNPKPKWANQLSSEAINHLLDACGTTLSGSGPLMPYDDRSNYEKGGAEQFFGWLVGTLQLKLRKRQLRGLSVPNRGP